MLQGVSAKKLPNAGKNRTISVIIPVFNEEKSISNTLAKAESFFRRYKRHEIIVVNDGSTDSTGNLLAEFGRKHKNIVVIEHARNMGVGAGLRTGLRAARGEIILTMDSDLTYPLEYVPKMIKALDENSADIAIASPFAKGGDSSQIPFLRKVLSYGANLLDRIVFGFDFTAPSCIFRAWNRKAAKHAKITFNRFEGVSESAICAHKKGYRIIDVPVKYHMIKGRKSSMNIAKTIKSHLALIIKLKFGD